MPAPRLASTHARCRPRGPRLPRLPPSLTLPPRASLDCAGRERWAPATPHPSVPDDASGPGAFEARASGPQSPPVLAGGREAGLRRAPPSHPLPKSTFHRAHAGAQGVGAHADRLPALHKAPGRPQTKREMDLRGRDAGGYWLLPAGACRPWHRAEGALPFHHPPRSCGPRPSPDTLIYAPPSVSAARPRVIYTQQWPADSQRPGRGGGVPPSPPGVAAGMGGGKGSVRREFDNWPRALKTKLKPSGGGSNLSHQDYKLRGDEVSCK